MQWHIKGYQFKEFNDHAGILFVRNLLKEDGPFLPQLRMNRRVLKSFILLCQANPLQRKLARY